MRAPPPASLIKRVPLALLVGILTLCATVPGRSSEEPKKILILFTHQSDQPAQAILEQAVRSTLQDELPMRPEIYYEYLDAVRTPLENYEANLLEQLNHKYSGKKFDLIFTVNAPALKFLLRHRAELGDAPIVFMVLDEQNLAGIDPAPNMTGVWGQVNYAASADLALRLQPDTRQIVVISGVGEWDNYWRSLVHEQLRPLEGRVAISYITGFTIPEQKEALAALPPRSVVLFVSSTRDKAGNSPGNLEVLRQICPSSSAPIYGGSDAQLGLGIVGGQLTSFNALGVEGARVGVRVLGGEKAETIAAYAVESVPMFDARQLQRWGIGQDLLPAGSVVQFKSPSAWEEYRWYWTGLAAVIIAEAILIGALLFLRLRRRQAVMANVELSSRLAEIVSNVPGIVWETRTDPTIGRRRTTYISDYVKRMLGYSAEEWLAQPPGFGASIIAEEDRGRVRDESEAVMKTGEVGVSEYRWKTKDGRIRWVENHIAPISDDHDGIVGLRGVALDITDRKVAEETARQTEEKDRAILAAIPDLMFIQTVDGVYLDYHAKQPDELLVPPESFVGKNMRDVLPPHLAEQIAECFTKAEDGGEPQILDYSAELDGVEKWFEARMVRRGDRILSIVRDITDLKRSEQEAHELSGRLIRAQEDERARLARELHDGVSQNLALFSIELALFGRDSPHDKATVDQKMKELSSRVGELSGEIRRLSQELHPVKLEQLGLVTAVRGFCHEVEAAHDVAVNFEVHDVPTSVPRNVSLCLYRIVQESLQNIVKHSGASSAHVLLSRNGQGLKLKITDDGCGFRPKSSSRKPSLGLVSMRERVHLLNGSFSISSEVGKGTEIEAIVPVDNGH